MGAVIVYGSTALALIFTAAWLWLPAFRAWVEQPKDQFTEDVRRYDEAHRVHTDPQGSARA
ncbi:MAG: hypothetical protein AB7O67_21375 [Vicinamibacterales bacterium]